jgi:uncharacterized protein YcnI
MQSMPNDTFAHDALDDNGAPPVETTEVVVPQADEVDEPTVKVKLNPDGPVQEESYLNIPGYEVKVGTKAVEVPASVAEQLIVSHLAVRAD